MTSEESAYPTMELHEYRSGYNNETGDEEFAEQLVFKGGLTKRERFAMAAMEGYISAGSNGMPTPSVIAKVALLSADALIEELNRDK